MHEHRLSGAGGERALKGRYRGALGSAEKPEGPAQLRSCSTLQQDGAASPASWQGAKVPDCSVLPEPRCSGKERDSLSKPMLSGNPAQFGQGELHAAASVFKMHFQMCPSPIHSISPFFFPQSISEGQQTSAGAGQCSWLLPLRDR